MGPISYGYKWERCDASGGNCVPIAGAGGKTYSLGSDDVGHTIRVDVTGTNPDGSQTSLSQDTAPVAKKAGAGDDISGSIPDSQVAPSKCQRILAGTGFKSMQIKGAGTIRVQVQGSAYISPTRPLLVTATATSTTGGVAKLRSLVYTLDSHVAPSSGRSPYSLSIAPAILASSKTHALGVRITPLKGRSHLIRLTITTAPCTNVLSAFQWKTAAGTRLRLRVDSRSALSSMTFKVPSGMLPKLTDAGTRPIGLAQIYLAGGAKVPFDLMLAKGDRTQTLLKPAFSAPRILLTKTGVVVSKLPPKVGIVEITLFTRDKTNPGALLAKGRKATLRATVKPAVGKAVKLTATVVAQRH